MRIEAINVPDRVIRALEIDNPATASRVGVMAYYLRGDKKGGTPIGWKIKGNQFAFRFLIDVIEKYYAGDPEVVSFGLALRERLYGKS